MRRLVGNLKHGGWIRPSVYLVVVGTLVGVIDQTMAYMPERKHQRYEVEVEAELTEDQSIPLGVTITTQPSLEPYRAPSITIGDLETVPRFTSTTGPVTTIDTATTSASTETTIPPESSSPTRPKKPKPRPTNRGNSPGLTKK